MSSVSDRNAQPQPKAKTIALGDAGSLEGTGRRCAQPPFANVSNEADLRIMNMMISVVRAAKDESEL